MDEIEELNDFYERAMQLATSWGLEPFATDFHIVPSHKLYEVASYGLPGHFSHWSYGRDYWRQKTMYDHGYGRIYELVINANPAQAFLLDTNDLIDNLFVIAHVIGHSDFFANNAYFAPTNRRIEQSVAAAADRFREYEIQFGRDVVEEFIDNVFAIKEHIDPHMWIKDTPDDYEVLFDPDPYLDLFPDEQNRRHKLEEIELERRNNMFPVHPEKDIVHFIADNARLKPWQRDVMMTIRDEMQYFLPQMQTKIMNEGWASIMHHEMMHELDVECDPGGIDFADVHSSVLSAVPGQLNPYWLGYNIYRRIMAVECKEAEMPESEWYKPGPQNPGWLKCLEVRQVERDESFIRNYLDEELCIELDLFSYEFNEDEYWWEITEKPWERVRDSLVASKANMGFPYLEIVDGNYRNTGELYIVHRFDGRPLDLRWATKTMKSVTKLWGKVAHLESYDKDGVTIQVTAGPDGNGVLVKYGEDTKLYD